jgi:F-type H+-transporting ATPase subunit gamma
MQMVSAAKMRKSQQATLASRSYAHAAWETLRTLGADMDRIHHALLTPHPKATKIGVVLITTNRGLVGGFNVNVMKTLLGVTNAEPELIAELVVLGRKGHDASSKLGQTIIAEFPKVDNGITIESISGLEHLLIDRFTKGQYQKVVVVYTQFVSTLQQLPTSKVLLPLVPPKPEPGDKLRPPLFEPSIDSVINTLLPRIFESQLYQALLESDTAEHASRMLMMKNATDAAGDLITGLNLTYNQLRQNKITTELSEITAGKLALE